MKQSIIYPNIVAALGGAERVDYSTRFAWIHLPGKPAPVRLPLSALPPLASWSAFNLADAAGARRKKKKRARRSPLEKFREEMQAFNRPPFRVAETPKPAPHHYLTKEAADAIARERLSTYWSPAGTLTAIASQAQTYEDETGERLDADELTAAEFRAFLQFSTAKGWL